MGYALAAAESSCGDLVRCTLGDGVSLCPQRCAAMAQDAETPSTQQLRLRRVLAFLELGRMLGIEVLEVKFMGQERFYGASTGYPSVKDIVAGARAGQLRGRPAGKAPVGSATSYSAPPKARRRTERRSFVTDTCAYARRATEAASPGKHPRPGQGAAVAAWRTTSIGPCASARI